MPAPMHMPSFANVDTFQLTPSESLLTTPWAQLPGGGIAVAGRSQTTGSYFDLPGFDEHLLFVHFRHRMHLDLRIDQVHCMESKEGDITIIPRHHATSWHTKGTAEALVLALPNSQLATTARQAFSAERSDWEFLPRVGFSDPLIYAVGQAVFDHLQCGGLLGNIYLETLLLTLTVRLVRQHVVFPVKMAAPHGYLSSNTLRSVTEYIENNIGEELSLSQLALLAQYSPFHFARCFRNSTGQSLHQFVLNRRLERATRLLESSDLTISTVAQVAGFSNHSQFAGHFRRKYNLTPHQYRRQARVAPSYSVPGPHTAIDKESGGSLR